MKALSETFISFCDLAEAEGRLLKQKIIQTAVVILLMIVAVVFLGVAIGLMVSVFFNIILGLTSLTIAYLLTSLLCLTIAGGLLWIGLIINRKA